MLQVYIRSATGDFNLVFTTHSPFINILRHIQCMYVVRAWPLDSTPPPALQTHH
jgi:hypothetical protein